MKRLLVSVIMQHASCARDSNLEPQRDLLQELKQGETCTASFIEFVEGYNLPGPSLRIRLLTVKGGPALRP